MNTDSVTQLQRWVTEQLQTRQTSIQQRKTFMLLQGVESLLIFTTYHI
jgi:hypothetical protein